jgi:hypothetical protein
MDEVETILLERIVIGEEFEEISIRGVYVLVD